MINNRDIENTLLTLGCRMTCKGFRYLQEMVRITYENHDAIFNLTKHVYSKVYEKFGAKIANVESALRTVIRNCWNENEKEIRRISIQDLKQPPTIKDFIEIVVHHLRNDNDD